MKQVTVSLEDWQTIQATFASLIGFIDCRDSEIAIETCESMVEIMEGMANGHGTFHQVAHSLSLRPINPIVNPDDHSAL